MIHYLNTPTYWILFFGCMTATAILTPIMMWLSSRVHALDRSGYRKINTGVTPLLGGLAIGLPFIAFCFLGFFASESIFEKPNTMSVEFVVLAIGGAIIIALGLVDDIRGLGAGPKYIVQTMVALIVCASEYAFDIINIPFLGDIQLSFEVGIVITILWITGLTNAFNIVDGIDGLATGVALLSLTGLAVLSAMNGSTWVVLLCVLLGAILLAFLPFNFPPARIFLGDSGSMFLGFTLATITLMGSQNTQGTTLYLSSIMVLGFPIFETLVSMLRRFLCGHPVFLGDQDHTHHRLLKRGFSPRRVLLIIYTVTFVLVIAGVTMQLIWDEADAVWIPLGLCFIPLASLSWIAGYLRPSKLTHFIHRRQRNSVLSALSRYAALSLNSDSHPENLDQILQICRSQLHLSFVQVQFEDYGVIAESRRATVERRRSNPSPALIREFPMTLGDGKRIIVRYQNDHDLNEDERQDIEFCLGYIFDRARIALPPEVTLQSRQHFATQAAQLGVRTA